MNACIITSASNKFFPSLINFLGSLHQNYPDHPPVYIYDLGLFFSYKKELEQIPWVKILRVPPFVPFWRSCYTWKAHILNAPLADLNLYIDAGCQVLQPMDEIFQKIDENGYFTVDQGKDIPAKDVIPASYLAPLNIKEEILEKNVITAGIFGFKKDSIIAPITERLYRMAKEGLCLGFSKEEQWKNKGVNKNAFVRNCPKFRHDTTLLTILIWNEMQSPVVESVENFSSILNKENENQYIWNLRLNYKKLEYTCVSHIHNKSNSLATINRLIIGMFFFLKSTSNKIKR